MGPFSIYKSCILYLTNSEPNNSKILRTLNREIKNLVFHI